MRIWMWSVFVTMVTFSAMILLKIPFWAFLLIAVPILIIVLIYGSFQYSFRESLAIQSVPEHGYKSRTNDLERESRLIELQGFYKIDQFYLRMIPDSITFVFKHTKEPVYFCIYHFGKKHTCDFVTRFENEYYLTTSSSVDAGMTPRPEKALLQIFPSTPYETLFQKHLKSRDYIFQNGISTFDIQEGEFRFYFMKSIKEQADHIRKSLFWPLMLLIRTISQYGRKFCSSIKEQYPQGFSKIGLQQYKK